MFYFERLVYLWSGWLQRASFSVFTPSRVMSGPTESYCGRSSLWVTMATRDILTVIMTNIDYWLWLNFWVEFLSLSSGVNVVWSLQTTVFMSFSASCDIRIGRTTSEFTNDLPSNRAWSLIGCFWQQCTLGLVIDVFYLCVCVCPYR